MTPWRIPPAGLVPDTSTIIGGNIIGVGSKINKHSIMVYEKAKNYRLFEFIWDPSKDNMGVCRVAGQGSLSWRLAKPVPFAFLAGPTPILSFADPK